MPETPEVIVKEYTPEEYAVVEIALQEFHERESRRFAGYGDSNFDGNVEQLKQELEWSANVAQQRLEAFLEDFSRVQISWDLLNRD